MLVFMSTFSAQTEKWATKTLAPVDAGYFSISDTEENVNNIGTVNIRVNIESGQSTEIK